MLYCFITLFCLQDTPRKKVTLSDIEGVKSPKLPTTPLSVSSSRYMCASFQVTLKLCHFLLVRSN